ncbi:MAG: hypothetical protein RLZZ469_1641 [Bacteroidota bacterium]|jgi:hypothetical protein
MSEQLSQAGLRANQIYHLEKAEGYIQKQLEHYALYRKFYEMEQKQNRSEGAGHGLQSEEEDAKV